MVVDESLVRRIRSSTALDDSASQWIVNVRVSKMGGLIRSLPWREEARAGLD